MVRNSRLVFAVRLSSAVAMRLSSVRVMRC